MNGGGLIDPDSAATVEEIEGCDALSAPSHVRVESGARLRDRRVGTLLGVAQRLFRRAGSTMGSPMDFSAETTFEHAVCVALLGVPYGEVVTVDEVARRAWRLESGCPMCRVCDAALRCPVRVIVPIHRVEGLFDARRPVSALASRAPGSHLLIGHPLVLL